MKLRCVLLVFSLVIFSGCFGDRQTGQSRVHSSTELIQNMVNNSLIDSGELSNFVDERRDGGAAAVLRMIIDYNDANSRDEFDRNIDNIGNNDLKRRLLIILENL